MDKKIILLMSLIALVGLVSAWAGEGAAPFYKGWNLVYGLYSLEQLDAGGG